MPRGKKIQFILAREGRIPRAHQRFGSRRQGGTGQVRAAAMLEVGAAAGAGEGGTGGHGGNYPRFCGPPTFMGAYPPARGPC